MRLVALIAGHAAGMLRRNHLWEVLGFGGILLVAARTQDLHIGQRRLRGNGVIGMRVFGLRPVAGLAGDMGMFAGGALFGFLVMAQDAFGLAGKRQRLLAIDEQSGGPEMAVLAEGFRH